MAQYTPKCDLIILRLNYKKISSKWAMYCLFSLKSSQDLLERKQETTTGKIDKHLHLCFACNFLCRLCCTKTPWPGCSKQRRSGRVVRWCWANFQCWASYNLDYSRARAYWACSRCRWGLYGHFYSHLSFLSSFSLSLRDGLI